MLNSLPLVVRGGARQLLQGQSQVLAVRRQLWAAVLPTATPSSAMHAIAAMPPTAVPPRTALASATRRFHSHTSPLLAQQHGPQHGQQHGPQPAVHHPRTLRQRLSNGWDQTVKIGRGVRRFATVLFVLLAGSAAFIAYKRRKALLTINDGSVIHVKLDKIGVTEAPVQTVSIPNLIARANMQSFTFWELLQTLKWIETDDRIRGLVVDFSSSGSASQATARSLGLAQLQELRDAIAALKTAKEARLGRGKFKLTAYTDTFESHMHYYLATAFDEIQMEPLGSIPLFGLSTVRPLFKGFFDKIGIELHSASVGEYKSAMSMFTDDEWSKPQLENTMELLNSLNDQIFHGIGLGRKTQLDKHRVTVDSEDGTSVELDNAAKLKNLADKAPLNAGESLGTGLVDRLDYKRKLMTISLVRYKLARSLEIEQENALALALNKDNRLGVAIIYLTGNIARGDRGMGGTAVAQHIAQAGNAPDVDAIVFRIDSGGGDPVASETMWEAVQHVSDTLKKPVVASFGNVAASGGYYAAASATKIVASPGTVTGSIGVAALRPYVPAETLAKAGIKIDVIALSDGVKNASIFTKPDATAWKRFQDSMNQVYKMFVDRVSTGRRMTTEEVENVARGRVWSGADAHKNGLVDQLGGLQDAVDLAETLAKAKKPAGYRRVVTVFPPVKPLISRILEADSPEAAMTTLHESLVDLGRSIVGALMAGASEQIDESLSESIDVSMTSQIQAR
ncbi:peptidase family S49-domain-containing protein [Entophlyctis helioformis]|nr:peptidase family S49-domain-containing protein [Entophlyctis helioformis]